MTMTSQETDPMGIRASDPPIKVTREIPLPYLLSLIGAILIFAATVYFTQQRQSEQIADIKVQMKSLADQLSNRTMADQEKDATRAAKVQEHDFQIQDLQRRMNATELRGAKR